MTMRELLAKHAEIATNVVAVGTLVGTIVWMTGGTFPPWFTASAAESMQRTIQEQQQAITNQLERVAKSLDGILKQQARNECDDLNHQLQDIRSRRDPSLGNLVALIRRRIQDIDGCMELNP